MSACPDRWYSFYFLVVALCLSLAQPLHAAAAKRVIIIETMPVPVVLEHKKWILNKLEALGYKPGNTLDLVDIRAKGDRDLAERELRQALVQGQPDLVITIATMATQAAVAVLRGTNIPILFCVVADPVGAGVVKKVGEPTGTNVTGRVYTVPRQTKIDFAMELVGQTKSQRPIRFGFIHSTYPSALGDLRELMALSQKGRDVRFVPYEVNYREVPVGMPTMLEDCVMGVAHLKDKIDFWWEPTGPMAEVDQYTSLLLKNSLVTIAMGNRLSSVKMGALLQISPNWKASGQEIAILADAILKGQNPGEIPVAYPTTFDLGINLSTALKLNIVVPPNILEMAGPNVYR